MQRALRPMAAARAARLRRAARLLALATGGSIGDAARVGQHVATRAHDRDQHHCGKSLKRNPFHGPLPLCVGCHSSSDGIIIASRNACGKAAAILWAVGAAAQKARWPRACRTKSLTRCGRDRFASQFLVGGAASAYHLGSHRGCRGWRRSFHDVQFACERFPGNGAYWRRLGNRAAGPCGGGIGGGGAAKVCVNSKFAERPQDFGSVAPWRAEPGLRCCGGWSAGSPPHISNGFGGRDENS